MGQQHIKPLMDEYGVFKDACDNLPEDLRYEFLKSIKELEDNTAHIKRQYQQTRLHKIKGIKKSIYRTDGTKISGWRIHVQFGENNFIRLCDLVEGEKHDNTLRIVDAKKQRYQ